MGSSPSVHYDEEATLEEARAEYFERNGFGADGGYSSPFVEVKLAGIPIRFPNTKGRVAAVRFHDLHHVATGYPTDNPGEAAIGAWELATGCRQYPAAWVLNGIAMAMGLFRAPRSTFRAYIRGRSTKNLYARPFDDALLRTTVGAVRVELGLHAPPRPPGLVDLAWFLFHATASVILGGIVIAPLIAVLLAIAWALV